MTDSPRKEDLLRFADDLDEALRAGRKPRHSPVRHGTLTAAKAVTAVSSVLRSALSTSYHIKRSRPVIRLGRPMHQNSAK